MKRLVLISVAVLCVMGLAFSVDAATRKKGAGKPGGMAACDGECYLEGFQMNRLKALDLDKKQKEAIKTIHFRAKKDMIKKRADIQVAEIELREMFSKDVMDMNAAEGAVKKIEGMKAEMRISHIKAREEIKSNLTPEQRKKFSSMMGIKAMNGREGMKGGCNKKCMDDNENIGYGHHDGGMPQMQHRHN